MATSSKLAALCLLACLTPHAAVRHSLRSNRTVAEVAANVKRKGDDDYEYGDAVQSVGDSDAADYSVGQFMAIDDARDGNTYVDEDPKARAQRTAVLEREDHFGSEDTPDPEASFAQVASKVHRSKVHRKGDDDYEYGDAVQSVGDSDAADYSVGQFMATDDARDGNSNVDEDPKARAQRTAVLEREDHFGSEDTPDPEASFAQVASKVHRSKVHRKGDDDYEYGDAVQGVGDSDAADYSVGQFMATDDARDGNSNVDDDPKARAQRTAVLEREDHFGSEDTPDPAASFAQVASTVHRSKAHRKGDGDDYEYGDAVQSVGDSDAADYSVGQFMATDDARDGNSNVDEDPKARAQRTAVLEREDHFGSEDTPDPDAS